MLIPRTTFQPIPFLSEILDGDVIPEGKLAYFRARFSNRLHELVLSTFLKREKESQLSRAELARRLGRKPEQITRWFASPGNWEISTVSDLLLGMGFEPDVFLVDLIQAIGTHDPEQVDLSATRHSGTMQELANMQAGIESPIGLLRRTIPSDRIQQTLPSLR